MANNNLPYQYLSGFNLIYLYNSQISIAIGYGKDSKNQFDIINNETIILNLKHKGVNGLDVGSLDNKFYNVFIISSSSGFSPTASLISLSNNQPYLPNNYDSFRLIGFITLENTLKLRANGTMLVFSQCGISNNRVFFYLTSAPLAISSVTETTPIDLSLLIPSLKNVYLLLDVYYVPKTAKNSLIMSLPNTPFNYIITGEEAGVQIGEQVTIPIILDTNGKPTFSYKVTELEDEIIIYINSFTVSL